MRNDPEMYPKDAEAIAEAAFEAHTGDKWLTATQEAKAQWRDKVPDAVKGRHSQAGLPAIEAAIVKAWEEYFAEPAPKKPKKEPEPMVKADFPTPKKK